MLNDEINPCLTLFRQHHFDPILIQPQIYTLTKQELGLFLFDQHRMSFAKSTKMCLALLLLNKIEDIIEISKTSQSAQMFASLPFFHISIFPMLYHYDKTKIPDLIEAQKKLFNPVFISSNPLVFAVFEDYTPLKIPAESIHEIFSALAIFLEYVNHTMLSQNITPLTNFGLQTFSAQTIHIDLINILCFLFLNYSFIYTSRFLPILDSLDHHLLNVFLSNLEFDTKPNGNIRKETLFSHLFKTPILVSHVFKENHTQFFVYCDFDGAQKKNPEYFL